MLTACVGAATAPCRGFRAVIKFSPGPAVRSGPGSRPGRRGRRSSQAVWLIGWRGEEAKARVAVAAVPILRLGTRALRGGAVFMTRTAGGGAAAGWRGRGGAV